MCVNHIQWHTTYRDEHDDDEGKAHTIKVDQIVTDCPLWDELQSLSRLYQRKAGMSGVLWK
jgi:hypothetical protein